MPINAQIPLQGQGVNASQAVQAGQNVQNLRTRNELLNLAVQNEERLQPIRESQAVTDEQKINLERLALGNAQLKPFLENGDVGGALEFWRSRIEQGRAAGRDMSDSEKMIPILERAAQTGDVAEPISIIDNLLDVNRQFNKGANTPAGRVQSVFPAPDGTVMLVMGDGTVVSSGQKRSETQRLTTLPSGEVVSVDVTGAGAGVAQPVIPQEQAIAGAAARTGAEEAARVGARTSPEAIAGEIEKETQVGLAQSRVEKIAEADKIIRGAEDQIRRIDSVIEEAKIALERITPATTGIIGSVARNVPGTEAFALSRNIDTIKANLSFDRIAEMRKNSPTGGALGQVSNIELNLLGSSTVALDQANTEEEAARAVEKVIEHYTNWKEVIELFRAQQEQLVKSAAPETITTPSGRTFEITPVPSKETKQ
jgi:hypothetical protein